MQFDSLSGSYRSRSSRSVASDAGSSTNGSNGESRQAFHVQKLIEDVPGKIECIVYYSQRVLIGTNDGKLLLYDTRRDQGVPVATKSFPHRRKIDQILVVPHVRTVLVLADGQITTHAATDLEPTRSDFTTIQGAKTMCLNQRGPPHFRICVSTKRKVTMFEFSSKEKYYKYLREFNTPDTPEAMAWYRNKLYLGYRKEYFLMNDKSGEALTINVSIDHHRTTPIVKLLPSEEILLTSVDRVGVFVDHKGEPLQRSSVTWSSTPSAIHYTQGYLIALMPKDGVEVHSLKDQALTQTIPISRAAAITGNGMKYDMEPRPSDDKDDVILIATANPSQVLRLKPLPIEQQVEDLLRAGMVTDALTTVKASIAKLSQDKQKQRLQLFFQRAGAVLLSLLRFEEAVEYLYQADIDPRELIAYFPELHCSKFAYQPAVLTSDVLPSGSSSSPPNMNAVIAFAQRMLNLEANTPAKTLFTKASWALLSLLQLFFDRRQRSQSSRSKANLDARSLEASDTALFRLCVMHSRKSELINLMRSDCGIDLGEAKSLLIRHRLYHELALLYQTRRMHNEALDIWYRLGIGEYTQSDINGVEPTVELLLNMDGDRTEAESLIWKYSKWLLEAHPDEGLKLFTNRRPRIESSQVLEHLKGFSDSTLPQRYLEMMVGSDKKKDEKAAEANHTRLALEYLDEVVQIVASGERPSSSKPGKEPGKLGTARKRLIGFLTDKSSNYNAQKVYAQFCSATSDLKRAPLIIEFTTLCCRTGKHADALNVFLGDDNRDFRGAEDYCVTCEEYVEKASLEAEYTKNKALLLLVEFCFTKKGSSSQSFKDFGFQLLRRHAMHIDGAAVLNLIPSDTSLAKSAEFLSQMMPKSAYIVRETMIARNLSNVYNLQVQCARADLQNKSVEILPDTKCSLCQKRIGDLVFAVYPNETIVHYKCTNGNLSVCPVTGENFSLGSLK